MKTSVPVGTILIIIRKESESGHNSEESKSDNHRKEGKGISIFLEICCNHPCLSAGVPMGMILITIKTRHIDWTPGIPGSNEK